jgi:tripartite-type tricarboxylate transporter receptor subunit TctC
MKWKLAVMAMLLPIAAAAQPNFAGKTVTIIVGYKAGGGYDATARLLARHLPKHIPGKPTVIVQNMPGAASPR